MNYSLLRKLIRESLLLEDLSGFRKKAAAHEYSIDIEDDPTFEKYPEIRKKARALKTAWKEEADHEFMDSVTKIHWMDDVNPEKIRKFLSGGKKSEISTMGYLRPPYTIWGFHGIGFQLQGRTTIAHNDMDHLNTGYFTGPGQLARMQKYGSSGVPKRPQSYRDAIEGSGYILDEESFNADGQGHNEFLVDNWEPIGFILPESTLNTLEAILITNRGDPNDRTQKRKRMAVAEKWAQIFRVLKEFGVPFMEREQERLTKEWLDETR